jgi:uncharacterized Fe-S cluster-containing protein
MSDGKQQEVIDILLQKIDKLMKQNEEQQETISNLIKMNDTLLTKLEEKIKIDTQSETKVLLDLLADQQFIRNHFMRLVRVRNGYDKYSHGYYIRYRNADGLVGKLIKIIESYGYVYNVIEHCHINSSNFTETYFEFKHNDIYIIRTNDGRIVVHFSQKIYNKGSLNSIGCDKEVTGTVAQLTY